MGISDTEVLLVRYPLLEKYMQYNLTYPVTNYRVVEKKVYLVMYSSAVGTQLLACDVQSNSMTVLKKYSTTYYSETLFFLDSNVVYTTD